jgi:hypothetical protein
MDSQFVPVATSVLDNRTKRCVRRHLELKKSLVYEQLEANKLLFDRCWSGAKKVT